MQTYFAPPERATEIELAFELQQITNNPVIDVLMQTANGLFAVLNGQRQILALNESFLRLMGIEHSEQSLGLRPGEYVRCVHACETPAGCGTSQYCSTCGAVIAILAAIDSDHPQERYCALTVARDNKEVDIFLQVRSNRLKLHDQHFILLFLQDMSIQQQRANLEQTFFHDINNLLCGILGRSQLLAENDAGHRQLHHGILRMAQEVAIQKALLASLADNYRPLYSESTVNRILSELTDTLHHHPLVGNRQLLIRSVPHDIPLVTDEHLANRILTNMICNALEATEPGGTVKVGIEPGGNSVSFSVWNAGSIPADIARRIFQRNFSTKQAMGRGLGTYSMKFFGEQVLGGQVGFETNPENGTTFTFTLMCQ